MIRHRIRDARIGAWALLAGLVLTASLPAQQQLAGSGLPNPRLTTLVPAGGKAGTTVEVTVTGTDLEEPQKLTFSHPGIKAEVVPPPAPPPADPKKPMPPAKPNQPVPTTNKFKVTLGADVPPGLYDARLVNRWGISNPRAFHVGDVPEGLEKEPNNDVAEAGRLEINSAVQGAIASPTDVDLYVFSGKKGQKVVISGLAAALDSRLTLGLEVYDARGLRLASARRYLDLDAVADVTLPEDGEYYVRVFEFSHTQGGADFIYRLAISTAPWIDAVFPPAVEPGKPTQVTLYGRNLPDGQPAPQAGSMFGGSGTVEKATVLMRPPADAAARTRLAYGGRVPAAWAGLTGFEYRARNTAGVSNPVLIPFARAPVVLEVEPNDTAEAAQKVSAPCEVAGQVGRRNDRDWFGFGARKGDVLMIEVISNREGAPTDMRLSVRNPAGKSTMADLDDVQEQQPNLKLYTRTGDPPAYRFVAPADGEYQVLVASNTAGVLAGPQQSYRLRVTPEQPDYQLVIMPADDIRPDSGRVLSGGSDGFSVFALRQDGFAGDIQLTAEGLPAGVACPPQTLGGAQRQATLVLTAAPGAAPAVGEFKVKGSGQIGGQAVVREARPASITFGVQPGQNIPLVSRLDRSLVLAVNDKAPYNLTAALDRAAVVQGDKANITVKLARMWPELKVPTQVAVLDPVPNLQVAALTIAPDKNDGTTAVTVGASVPPGNYSLVLRGTAQGPYAKDPMAKQKPNVNLVQVAPPVVLTVVPRSLGTLAVNFPGGNLKAGAQGEAVVKVTRQFDFPGEFKLRVVLPGDAKGLTVAEGIIPAGQEEAKLMVKAAPDAPPGARNGLVVKATAMFQGKTPVVHEAKFNVNVVK